MDPRTHPVDKNSWVLGRVPYIGDDYLWIGFQFHIGILSDSMPDRSSYVGGWGGGQWTGHCMIQEREKAKRKALSNIRQSPEQHPFTSYILLTASTIALPAAVGI